MKEICIEHQEHTSMFRARRLHLSVQKQGQRSDTSETITYKANDCRTPCIVQISLKSFQAAGITFCLS